MLAEIRPQIVHIPQNFVDCFAVAESKLVDKRLAASRSGPVWFVLPEGAFGTVRRGEERSTQRRRFERDRTSVRTWSDRRSGTGRPRSHQGSLVPTSQPVREVPSGAFVCAELAALAAAPA